MASLTRSSQTLFLALALAACGEETTAPRPEIAVLVSPEAATILAAATQAFIATVSNARNDFGVDWTASAGSISTRGNWADYTAPLAGGFYVLTASSREDPTKSASVLVTVPTVSVSVFPAVATLFPGETQRFRPLLVAAINSDVTWSATCGSLALVFGDYYGFPYQTNEIDYTAPQQPTSCDVRATSVLDPSLSAIARVTVLAPTQ